MYDPGPRELRPGNGERPPSEPPGSGRDPDFVGSDPEIPMRDLGPRELRPGDGPRPEEPPLPDLVSIGDGPSLADDAPDLWLPYPGDETSSTSVTLGCNASLDGGRGKRGCTGFPPGKQPKHRKAPRVKGGVTVEGTVTSTSGRSDDYLTIDGERTDLTVSMELALEVGASVDLKYGGVGYTRTVAGDRTTYVLTVSPERAEAIAAGTADAPNLRDPRTLEAGDGLLLNEDEFGGGTSSANLGPGGPVQFEHSTQSGERELAGVRRIDEDTIRITVGDAEFVRETIRLGVGIGDLAGASVWSEDDAADGEAMQVDLDISTASGWRDYQRFIDAGRIPHRPDIEHARVERHTYTYTAGSSLKLGPIEHSETSRPLGSDIQDLKHGDGSTQRIVTFRENGTTMTRIEGQTPDGYDKPAQNRLLLQDVDADSFGKWDESAVGDTAEADGETVDARVELTDAELQTLRLIALDTLRDRLSSDADTDFTTDEVVGFMRDRDSDVGAPMGFQLEGAMVRAQDPAAILDALYYEGRRHPEHLAMWFSGAGYYQQQFDRGDELPGELTALED